MPLQDNEQIRAPIPKNLICTLFKKSLTPCKNETLIRTFSNYYFGHARYTFKTNKLPYLQYFIWRQKLSKKSSGYMDIFGV
jgi:hypothetical protein